MPRARKRLIGTERSVKWSRYASAPADALKNDALLRVDARQPENIAVTEAKAAALSTAPITTRFAAKPGREKPVATNASAKAALPRTTTSKG